MHTIQSSKHNVLRKMCTCGKRAWLLRGPFRVLLKVPTISMLLKLVTVTWRSGANSLAQLSKLPLIFPGAPLKINGTPGNIQGNLTALQGVFQPGRIFTLTGVSARWNFTPGQPQYPWGEILPQPEYQLFTKNDPKWVARYKNLKNITPAKRMAPNETVIPNRHLTFVYPTGGCTWGEERGSKGRHILTDSDRRSQLFNNQWLYQSPYKTSIQDLDVNPSWDFECDMVCKALGVRVSTMSSRPDDMRQ